MVDVVGGLRRLHSQREVADSHWEDPVGHHSPGNVIFNLPNPRE